MLKLLPGKDLLYSCLNCLNSLPDRNVDLPRLVTSVLIRGCLSLGATQTREEIVSSIASTSVKGLRLS